MLPLIGISQTVMIKNLRLNNLPNKLQYVVDLTGMVPVTQHTYYHPYRKVYSFYHVKLARLLKTSQLGNAYVSRVRAERSGNRISIGLHLVKDFPVHASFWSASQGKGMRYVIEVSKKAINASSKTKNVTFDRSAALNELHKAYGPSIDRFVQEHIGSSKIIASPITTHTKKRQSPKAFRKTTTNTNEANVFNKVMAVQKQQEALDEVQLPIATDSTYTEHAKRYSSKIIVVIDPGHGGKDPGATGPKGHHEKMVVLAIAKQLQKQINSYPGFKAVLTRGDDRYLTLRYRLALAREYHGDMFVAIHADAFINATARGASVFALSQRGATSEAARWLAQRENQSELMGGVDLADKDQTLRSVLIDLSQTATISASLNMGSGIISHLRQIMPMHAYHVEQAAFVVLKSPDIPSLLVETGFISNPTEEQQLIMRSHQQKVAQAIAKGIVNYFRTHPPRGSWLATHTHG